MITKFHCLDLKKKISKHFIFLGMPHFDEDDRDEVFEKDSKESKEFKENGEEMDVDVDDDQVNIWGFFYV